MQRPFTLLGEFADPETEDAYQDQLWRETRKRIWYVCLISAFVYLSAVAIDYCVLGTGALLLLMIASRFTVFCLGMLAALYSRSASCNARRLGWVLSVYMLSILLSEAFELHIKSAYQPSEGVPPVVIIMLTFYFVVPPKALPTLIACVTGSVCYTLSGAFAPLVHLDYVLHAILFFFLANGFGLVTLVRFGKSRRREYLAMMRLKELAEIDTLTQIFNRRKTFELCGRMFDEARRYGYPLSVLLLDIDHFKSVNDSYGHAGGDAVLQEVTNRCTRQLRKVDVFGRIGGEEFLVCLSHSDLKRALLVAERLRRDVNCAPVVVQDTYADVTVSIGAAEITAEMATLESLVHQADLALYRAKESGRDRICTHGTDPVAGLD